MKNLNDVISEMDDVLSSAKRGNIDELISKTKSYAAAATKKSAERLELSRRKIELLDSKAKLSKAYEKYGRLMYSASCGVTVDEEELSSAASEIQLQKTKAELFEKEIADLKAVFKKSEVDDCSE